MKALIQRVKQASVIAEGSLVSSIEAGLLVFLGIGHEDGTKQIEWIVRKILSLRVFENEGKLDFNVQQVKGSILVVSQFTLYANCLKGSRPDFMQSAKTGPANIIYHRFLDHLKKQYPLVEKGVFQAHMEINLINDGPVTLMLESP